MTNGEIVQKVWDVSNIRVYSVFVVADIYPCKDMMFDKSWWFAKYDGSLSFPEREKETDEEKDPWEYMDDIERSEATEYLESLEGFAEWPEEEGEK